MTNGNRWRPYPERRESSIGWLGEIPLHWQLYRLRHVAAIQSGLALGRNLEGRTTVTRPYLRVANVQDGYLDLDSITTVAIPPDEVTRYELRKGDVLMTEGGDFDKLGRGYVWEGQVEGCLHQNHVFAVRPQRDRLDPYYLALLMSSLHGKNYFTSTSQQTTNLATINRTKLGNFPIVLPPLHEQRQIIAWLTQQLARIDALIAKKQRLIELLLEKRTALINHAVTKGLDAGVAMKESGVAWLGEVPAHWRTARIRDVALSLQTGPFGSQLHADEYITDGIPIINPAHLKSGRIQPDRICTVNQRTWLRLARHELLEGDIIFARRGEMGRCALVTTTEQGWLCGSGSLRLRPSRDMVDPVFLSWMLSTTGVAEWLSLESVGTTMDNLSAKIIGQIPLPIPPLSEQQAIADYLILETARMIGLSGKINTAIEKLREYRTALISAAVTGKIDVRGTDHG